MESRRRWIFLLVAGIGAFYFLTIRGGHDWGGDFSQYIHHAQNIVRGIDYSETGYIFNPRNPIAPVSYPPVFPLLLAPVVDRFGLNLKAMKAMVVIFFILSLLMIHRTFKEQDLEKRALGVIALTGLSPFFWEFKDQVLSDIPFMFFVFGSLYFINRLTDSADAGRELRWPAILGASSFIFFAFGTRSIGIALLPVPFLADFIRSGKPRFRKATLLTAFFFVVAVVIQNSLVDLQANYLDFFSFHLKAVVQNVFILGKSVSALWSNSFSVVFRVVLTLGLTALAAVGLWNRMTRYSRSRIFEIYFVCNFLMVIVWPFPQGLRYMIPVIPLYFFYVLEGFAQAKLLIGPAFRKKAVWIFTGLIALSYASKYIAADYGQIKEGMAKTETKDLFLFVNSRTNPDDVFIFSKPRVLALFTGRKAAVYHQAGDKELGDFFRRIGATYVISGKPFDTDGRILDPYLERNEDSFIKVFENSDFRAYKIKIPDGGR